MHNKNRMITMICFIFFMLVSTFMAFFSFEGYSIISNTTSHLAAQGTPFAWLMNVVFLCLGINAFLISYSTRVRYHQVIGGIFGISLVLTAFFPHAPLVTGMPVNIIQDRVHSFLASSAGLSFTILAIGHGVMSHGRQRIGGIALAIVAILIPIGMIFFPSFMGLLQRFMFISCFGWLFFYMQTPQDKLSAKSECSGKND